MGRGPEAHKRPRKGCKARKGWEKAQKARPEKAEKKPRKGPEARKGWEEAQKRPRRGPEARKGWEEAPKGPEKAPRPAAPTTCVAARLAKVFPLSSDAQADPSSKKLETQPLGKAPQPISKKLVWGKLKPKTFGQNFGQNFRSKLSVKTKFFLVNRRNSTDFRTIPPI